MRKYFNTINVNITEHKNEEHETPMNCNTLLLHALLLATTVLYKLLLNNYSDFFSKQNSTFGFK